MVFVAEAVSRNRNYVDQVQITASDELGVERPRAGFYENDGALAT